MKYLWYNAFIYCKEIEYYLWMHISIQTDRKDVFLIMNVFIFSIV